MEAGERTHDVPVVAECLDRSFRTRPRVFEFMCSLLFGYITYLTIVWFSADRSCRLPRAHAWPPGVNIGKANSEWTPCGAFFDIIIV